MDGYVTFTRVMEVVRVDQPVIRRHRAEPSVRIYHALMGVGLCLMWLAGVALAVIVAYRYVLPFLFGSSIG